MFGAYDLVVCSRAYKNPGPETKRLHFCHLSMFDAKLGALDAHSASRPAVFDTDSKTLRMHLYCLITTDGSSSFARIVKISDRMLLNSAVSGVAITL